MTRTRILFAATLAAVTVTGCATGNANVRRDTRYIARDVNTLYSAAQARIACLDGPKRIHLMAPEAMTGSQGWAAQIR